MSVSCAKTGCGTTVTGPARHCSKCGKPFHFSHGTGVRCDYCKQGFSK